MAHQQPYILSQQPYIQYPSYRQQFSDQQLHSANTSPLSMSSTVISSVPSSNLAQSSFRAPAHKHAHHLHSIPPREKSTRTLIIDHMLWVHARTRFSQARAELGMTDRTGGPRSPNYTHRTRPELYEEEDEDGSEGEDVVPLKARAGGPGHLHDDEEDERQRHQDLSLARSLRLRAEGLEKVITSMLEQPPPIHHPVDDEDIFTPPTSPNLSPSLHPHTLPNGVRLRLALGTIINDLFARQAPPPPYRHTLAPNSKITTPPDHSPSVAPSPSNLPAALSALAPVSGAFAPMTQPALMSLPSPAYPTYGPPYVTNARPPFSQQPQMQFQVQHQNMPPPPRRRPRPRSRTRRLYAAGADPSTANSPPSFRCPRHLHTGCEICVEAKSPPRQSGSSNSHRRGNSFGMDRSGTVNSWRTTSGGVIPGRGGGITGWQDGSGIGSGLLRPGVKGSALRRKAREPDSTAGAGNTKLSKLIPRFIRLSALVAAELGREARGEEEEVGDIGRDKDTESSVEPGVNLSTPGRNDNPNWNTGPPSPVTPKLQLQKRMYENALRPSLEWYMLLAGLLTRAVLEGYLTAGWSGLQAIQCLLLVGLGLNVNAAKMRDNNREEEEDEEEFADLDPDELPNLVDAIKVLFPALRDGGLSQKGREEEEYEAEMFERLNKFYDIPTSTPDCSTHMEDLAWQYPAEPVERSAVRFCEAIARWRGKPELETKPIINSNITSVGTPGGSSVPVMTIDSLVHSNPTSPTFGNTSPETSRRRRVLKRPSIDVYFLQSGVQRRDSGSWNRGNNNKRYRDADDDINQERAKRPVYS